MSLNYFLVNNKLTPDPDDCTARTSDVNQVSFEEIIKKMTARGLTLTDTEVKGVFNEFIHTLNDVLQEGYAVSTPFIKIRPSIVGVFTDGDDAFDPSRHAVKLNASLGSEVSINQQSIKTSKVRPTSIAPEIMVVKDYQTQRENESITRNGSVEIKGSDLKIDPLDKEQGVFIMNGTQEARATLYMHNKPSHIIFMVPEDAPEGSVRLQVRNKAKDGNLLRRGTFEIDLTVL